MGCGASSTSADTAKKADATATPPEPADRRWSIADIQRGGLERGQSGTRQRKGSVETSYDVDNLLKQCASQAQELQLQALTLLAEATEESSTAVMQLRMHPQGVEVMVRVAVNAQATPARIAALSVLIRVCASADVPVDCLRRLVAAWPMAEMRKFAAECGLTEEQIALQSLLAEISASRGIAEEMAGRGLVRLVGDYFLDPTDDREVPARTLANVARAGLPDAVAVVATCARAPSARLRALGVSIAPLLAACGAGGALEVLLQVATERPAATPAGYAATRLDAYRALAALTPEDGAGPALPRGPTAGRPRPSPPPRSAASCWTRGGWTRGAFRVHARTLAAAAPPPLTAPSVPAAVAEATRAAALVFAAGLCAIRAPPPAVSARVVAEAGAPRSGAAGAAGLEPADAALAGRARAAAAAVRAAATQLVAERWMALTKASCRPGTFREPLPSGRERGGAGRAQADAELLQEAALRGRGRGHLTRGGRWRLALELWRESRARARLRRSWDFDAVRPAPPRPAFLLGPGRRGRRRTRTRGRGRGGEEEEGGAARATGRSGAPDRDETATQRSGKSGRSITGGGARGGDAHGQGHGPGAPRSVSAIGVGVGSLLHADEGRGEGPRAPAQTPGGTRSLRRAEAPEREAHAGGGQRSRPASRPRAAAPPPSPRRRRRRRAGRGPGRGAAVLGRGGGAGPGNGRLSRVAGASRSVSAPLSFAGFQEAPGGFPALPPLPPLPAPRFRTRPRSPAAPPRPPPAARRGSGAPSRGRHAGAGLALLPGAPGPARAPASFTLPPAAFAFGPPALPGLPPALALGARGRPPPRPGAGQGMAGPSGALPGIASLNATLTGGNPFALAGFPAPLSGPLPGPLPRPPASLPAWGARPRAPGPASRPFAPAPPASFGPQHGAAIPAGGPRW
eukprot:tig00021238_g19546.t1